MQLTFTIIFVGLDGVTYAGTAYSESVLQSYLARCQREGWPMCLVTAKGARMAERPLLLLTRKSDGRYRQRTW
jgi:hypothetical protein